ncbi:hypothetical protein Pla123a_30760 [Posidoniimonas polymericola]|uniref:DUF3500 domain-containing protein n=1 Tax=Posidoniimonas polymericola TaxID=2528002 RepID=A0A5C5YL13_9BACT|nr:DUF3500 domain-containing protein [Posidoniimonas polymericola]TWT75566.1 hypothetical protein Pla123a_30760 [Posidoniimonas polymericola]
MHQFLSNLLLLFLALSWVALTPDRTSAHEAAQHQVNEEMRDAAVEFLSTLPDEQRQAATFAFDGPQRTDWQFVPMERVGLPLRDMTLEQRRAARKLMRSVLSDQGYLKATTIMSLERVLRLIEADREDVENIRNPEKYWFAVYGEPDADRPWGWRVEGHHLSLNLTSDGQLVVSTAPLFLGANPHEVRVGPRLGLRALGGEEDRFRALMGLFSEEQRRQASIASEAPRDVATVPGAPIDLGKPAGLPYSQMTPAQQSGLTEVVTGVLQNLRPELAAQELAEIERAGYSEIYFAWAGGLGPDENHYFRVHGPTFVFEYDNAQGNHSHLVWHSTKNDFGLDKLQQHYEQHEHAHAE